jgi:hypothetical protein
MKNRYRLYVMNGYTPAAAAWYAMSGVFRMATVRRFAFTWLS